MTTIQHQKTPQYHFNLISYAFWTLHMQCQVPTALQVPTHIEKEETLVRIFLPFPLLYFSRRKVAKKFQARRKVKIGFIYFELSGLWRTECAINREAIAISPTRGPHKPAEIAPRNLARYRITLLVNGDEPDGDRPRGFLGPRRAPTCALSRISAAIISTFPRIPRRDCYLLFVSLLRRNPWNRPRMKSFQRKRNASPQPCDLFRVSPRVTS